LAPLTRDPFLADPFRIMDEVFGRVLGDGGQAAGFTPRLDVRETDEEYVVMVDVPGVRSDDVQIELRDQILTISGTRVPVETGEAQRVERPFGAFSRMLTLPQGIDPDSIRADYADGVLTLHVPKPGEAKPKKIARPGAVGEGARSRGRPEQGRAG
jgi:HSP20 family protein